MIESIIGIVCLAIGIAIGRFLLQSVFTSMEVDAKNKAQAILKEAELYSENLKKEKLLEAKEKYQELKLKHDEEVLERNGKLTAAETRIKQKETISKI